MVRYTAAIVHLCAAKACGQLLLATSPRATHKPEIYEEPYVSSAVFYSPSCERSLGNLPVHNAYTLSAIQLLLLLAQVPISVLGFK